MQQLLSDSTSSTLFSDTNSTSSQPLMLYTTPIGGHIFAVAPDGTVLMAQRVPPEIDDLPLWILFLRDQSGKIVSFSPIKSIQRYFSTEEIQAVANSYHATEWHQGVPPPINPKITKPLKEDRGTVPSSPEKAPSPERKEPSEEEAPASAVTPEAFKSPSQHTPSAVDLERQWRERAIQSQIDKLATARATDIQKITATQLSLDNNYCQEALQQGQKSFQFAVKFAPWAIVFIAGSTLLLIVLTFTLGLGHLDTGAAVVNGLGGLLMEGLPGVGFFLYYQASRQFKEFSRRIDLRNRYLLANSIIITSLEGQEKQQALLKLVDNILQGEEPEIISDNNEKK